MSACKCDYCLLPQRICKRQTQLCYPLWIRSCPPEAGVIGIYYGDGTVRIHGQIATVPLSDATNLLQQCATDLVTAKGHWTVNINGFSVRLCLLDLDRCLPAGTNKATTAATFLRCISDVDDDDGGVEMLFKSSRRLCKLLLPGVRNRRKQCPLVAGERPCKKRRATLSEQEQEGCSKKDPEEEDVYEDEAAFDITDPCEAWTRRRLEYYLLKHSNTPDMLPLLVSIDTYCPVSFGNPRFICTLVHPISGDKVQVSLASTVLCAIAEYKPTILKALTLVEGSAESTEINLCAVNFP